MSLCNPVVCLGPVHQPGVSACVLQLHLPLPAGPCAAEPQHTVKAPTCMWVCLPMAMAPEAANVSGLAGGAACGCCDANVMSVCVGGSVCKVHGCCV